MNAYRSLGTLLRAGRVVSVPAALNLLVAGTSGAGNASPGGKSDTDVPELFQVILEVPNMREAVAFYLDVLNLDLVEPAARAAAEGASFARLRSGGYFLALHHTTGTPTRTRLSFSVQDLATAREQLTTRGIPLGPTRTPAQGVYVADVRDPAGNTIHLERNALLQPYSTRGRSMLAKSNLISFVCSTKPEEARAFYTEVLGLEFVREEPGAQMFIGNGRLLRMQTVRELPRAQGAILGWEVSDIAAQIAELEAKGVVFQRYDGFPQDERGIATFPNGDQVAWFLDPDGNVLSLSQLTPMK